MALSELDIQAVIDSMPGASDEEVKAEVRRRNGLQAGQSDQGFLEKWGPTALRTALPIAGSVLGGRFLPGLGKVGAALGGAVAGALGEAGAESMEGRELSPGAIASAGLLGGYVPSAVPGKTSLGILGKRALEGAQLGVGGKTIETVLDEGRTPTWEEVGLTGGMGGVFGGAFGALEGAPALVKAIRPPFVERPIAEFPDALAQNRAAATLTQEPPQKFFQKRGGKPLYFGINDIPEHPVTGQPERDLTAVMNNGDAPGALAEIMPEALRRGVTTLDAWAVPSEKYPGGFLPEKYAKYGFKEYKRVPYDLSYGEPDAATKAGWATQGWKEGDPLPDVSYMRAAEASLPKGPLDDALEGLYRKGQAAKASVQRSANAVAALLVGPKPRPWTPPAPEPHDVSVARIVNSDLPEAAKKELLVLIAPQARGSRLGSKDPNIARALAAPAASPLGHALFADQDEDTPEDRAFKARMRGIIDVGAAAATGGIIAASLRKGLGHNAAAAGLQKHAASVGAAMLHAGSGVKRLRQTLLEMGVQKADLGKVEATAQKTYQQILERTAQGGLTKTKQLMQMLNTGAGNAAWYDTRDELVKMFGDDAEKFAYLLAATSNNATVKANVALALKVYGQWKLDPSKDPIGIMKSIVPAAKRALASDPLMGRKVHNFGRALMGDPDAVVVDRWILRAFNMKGTGVHGDVPTQQQYDFIEERIKQIAKEQNMTPAGVQAALWYGIKGKVDKGANATPPTYHADLNLREQVGAAGDPKTMWEAPFQRPQGRELAKHQAQFAKPRPAGTGVPSAFALPGESFDDYLMRQDQLARAQALAKTKPSRLAAVQPAAGASAMAISALPLEDPNDSPEEAKLKAALRAVMLSAGGAALGASFLPRISKRLQTLPEYYRNNARLMGDSPVTAAERQTHLMPEPDFDLAPVRLLRRLGGEVGDPTPGINEAWIAQLGDPEHLIQTVHKPGVNKYDASPLREKTAFEIDRALGLGLVPTVGVQTGKNSWVADEIVPTSDMRWIESDKYNNYKARQYNAALPPINEEDLAKFAVLDSMIMNTDRHRGNVTVTPDGRLVAIDNGYALATEQAAWPFQEKHVSEVELPLELRQNIVSNIDNADWETILQALKDVDAKAARTVQERLSPVKEALMAGDLSRLQRFFY